MLVLDLVGIASLGYLLMLRLLRTQRGAVQILLLPMHEGEQMQEKLYALHLRRRLLGEGERCAIIALDTGLTEQERRALARFCLSVPRMYCCTASELPTLLQTIRK